MNESSLSGTRAIKCDPISTRTVRLSSSVPGPIPQLRVGPSATAVLPSRDERVEWGRISTSLGGTSIEEEQDGFVFRSEE